MEQIDFNLNQSSYDKLFENCHEEIEEEGAEAAAAAVLIGGKANGNGEKSKANLQNYGTDLKEMSSISKDNHGDRVDDYNYNNK